ncbi:MAG: hypothetical protein HXY34_09125 [Candidatus Thorarchaeota archaeon]|nr:hypothetical protein [Candidatus Thorarchaeota archaeon]
MKDDRVPKSDERDVVDGLLTEMGVDDDMRKQLLESGRITGDVFKVESAEDVRRRTEIEKSIDRLRDSLNLVERDLTTVDTAIDRIERDLIPVVLSFLVSLKGSLVNLRTTVISEGKRRAKTNLQATYVDNEMRAIVDAEFARIENSLTTQMSSPIMEKTRDVTDGLRTSLKQTFTELATLKASVDDLVQRAATEVEFLTKEVSMKPKVQVPKEVEEKIRVLERTVEELRRDLVLSADRLANREKEIEMLRIALETEKARTQSLEDTVTALRAAPSTDPSVLTELRQQVKALETTRDLLNSRLEDATKRIEEADKKTHEALSTIARKDLEIDELRTRASRLEQEREESSRRLGEIDELKARIRSYESGDMAREHERTRVELERATAVLERMTRDFESLKARLAYAEKTVEDYMALMESTEKTKAFLMVEEAGQLSVREIGRSLGISPGQILKWAEDFERLGIARVVDGETLVLTRQKPVE